MTTNQTLLPAPGTPLLPDLFRPAPDLRSPHRALAVLPDWSALLAAVWTAEPATLTHPVARAVYELAELHRPDAKPDSFEANRRRLIQQVDTWIEDRLNVEAREALDGAPSCGEVIDSVARMLATHRWFQLTGRTSPIDVTTTAACWSEMVAGLAGCNRH